MMRQPNNQVYKTVVIVWLTLSVASVLLSAITWWQLNLRMTDARDAMAIQDEADSIIKLAARCRNQPARLYHHRHRYLPVALQRIRNRTPRTF